MVCMDKGWLYSVPFVRSESLPYPLHPKNAAYTEITNAEWLLERFVLHEMSVEYPEDQFVLVLGQGGLRAICMARGSLNVSVMKE